VCGGGFNNKMTHCSKTGFPSFREAQTALHQAYNGQTRHRKKDKKLRRSYKCEDCGMWHLTSKINKTIIKR